jgi:hypothetical protein
MKFIDDKFIELKKQLAFNSSALVISIVSGLAPNWFHSDYFSGPEQFLFGTLVFTILILFDILCILALSTAHQIQASELWRMSGEGDYELANIRANYLQIAKQSYGEKDLFITYFKREFVELGRIIKEAAENGRLQVSKNHFTSADQVLAVLYGEDDPVWRCTWEIDVDERLFGDLPSRRYCEVSHKMLHQKAMKETRTVFILDDITLIKAPRIAKLLDFYQTNDGYDCRIMNRADYEALCLDNGIPSQSSDIGIYGSRLLFVTEQYGPPTIGVFTKDSESISRYRGFFDTIWDSHSVAVSNPSAAKKKVSLEELFQFDENPQI